MILALFLFGIFEHVISLIHCRVLNDPVVIDEPITTNCPLSGLITAVKVGLDPPVITESREVHVFA
jgi:hypothetical protein